MNASSDPKPTLYYGVILPRSPSFWMAEHHAGRHLRREKRNFCCIKALTFCGDTRDRGTILLRAILHSSRSQTILNFKHDLLERSGARRRTTRLT